MDGSKSAEKPGCPPEQDQPEHRTPKQSEQYLHLLQIAVEIMQIGVLIADLDGRIVYVNQAQADMHGYQAAALLARPMQIFLPYKRRRPLSLDQIKSLERLNPRGMESQKGRVLFSRQGYVRGGERCQRRTLRHRDKL